MLMRSLVRTRPVSNSTRPIAFGAIANRTRSSTPLLSSITARPFPPCLSSLLAPPRIFIAPWRPHSFSRTVKPRRELRLALPRLASRRVASARLNSTRLDSPQVDSTRLDSTRFVSFRSVSPVSSLVLPRLASPRLCSLVLADPEDCNSRSFSSDPHRFSDESRMISRLAGVAPLIKSYQESPMYLDTYIGCLRIVKPQLL